MAAATDPLQAVVLQPCFQDFFSFFVGDVVWLPEPLRLYLITGGFTTATTVIIVAWYSLGWVAVPLGIGHGAGLLWCELSTRMLSCVVS
jgi:hypothetical protein